MYGHPVFLIADICIRSVVQQQFRQISGTFHADINQGRVAGFVTLVHVHAAPFQKGLYYAFLVVPTCLQQHIIQLHDVCLLS